VEAGGDGIDVACDQRVQVAGEHLAGVHELTSRTMLPRTFRSSSAAMALDAQGTMRFARLKRSVEGITQKMLTQTLRALQRDGMVSRTVHPTVPVTVEYTLTPLGRGLADTVHVLRQWAYANMDDIAAARAEFDASDRLQHVAAPG